MTAVRALSAMPEAKPAEVAELANVRNIGISAHIDSGKTTLTERILFYTGRINDIHEVRGRDGVGAKMDSMDLEREKGITIQSAATYTTWKDKQVNIIDTPGHVDFTIEVERALRVLDGAVLVLCSVGGVQSQSITVDRQMRRYNVPRVIFINKLDRAGADPWKVMQQARDKLKINCAAVQIPIGVESDLKGIVDLVERKAYQFSGHKGTTVEEIPVPVGLTEEMEARRAELVERVADSDEVLGEAFLMEEPIEAAELKAAIRRQTIARNFCPLFMGSAIKNTGVQLLLDGVSDYLPSPLEVENKALDLDRGEEPVVLTGSPSGPLVALAFKLEEGRYGQLTYMRIYSGTLKKSDVVLNTSNGKKVKIPRLVRMHSEEMQEVQEAKAGDIAAVFGVDCASGDTFTDGQVNFAMTTMSVPEPVMSLAVTVTAKDSAGQLSKALNKFTKEDPTFKVSLDAESGQTIISGMGELHLEVYVERMKREYKIECEVGKPRVNFREAITRKATFDYLHKKQSGGSGQYAKVQGYIEPLPKDGPKYEFENGIIGMAIPSSFIPACDKGFQEAINSGSLIGHPVEGVRVVLTDGAAHAVDSSEMAFKLASLFGFRQAYHEAGACIMEPVMQVEVVAPTEFQGSIVGNLNRRKGVIQNTETEGEDVIIRCHVPLNNMFGYSTDLRSMTQGRGEFTMEYLEHAPVPRDVQDELTETFRKSGDRRQTSGL